MKAIDGAKRCSKCCKWKHVGQFGCHRSKPDGLSCWCRACLAEKRRKYRAENPEKVSEGNKKYRANNSVKERARVKEWKASNPEKVREHRRVASQRERENYKWMREKLRELGIPV